MSRLRTFGEQTFALLISERAPKGHRVSVVRGPLRLEGFGSPSRRLPAVVGERLVRLGHPVGIVLLLDRATLTALCG